MPRSVRPFSSEQRPRPLRGDERAVSEVIGQILVFGILSIVLVMSMLAFNVVKASVTDRAAGWQAEAASSQVASVTIEGALFAERHDGEVEYIRHLDLPDDFEGRTYRVYLEPAGSGHSDRIRLHVDGIDQSVTASLMSAGAASSVHLLESDVPGGPLAVVYKEDPSCSSIGADRCLFLEALP